MKLDPKKFLLFSIIFYFATRLFNLGIIPIFTDEAIYSYWAQVALHDPANRFISLEDGKQPLFVWLAALMQKFIGDPLVATRLVSVFAGFGSILGIYLMAKELLGEKIARLSVILYIILPFTLLYDRLGIFDSLLTMLGIYATFFSIKLAKNPKIENAIYCGVSIGLALINKSSGIFFLYLMPVSLIFFNFERKNLPARFLKWVGSFVIAIIISQLFYNLLRLSPLFYLIDRKNHEFIRTFSEVIEMFGSPLLNLFSNVNTIISWLVSYNGPILVIFAAAAMIFGFIRRNWSLIFLTFYVITPFLAEVVFNKVFYPRFALFYFPYVIILISYMIINLIENIRFAHVISDRNYKKYQKYIWVLMAAALILPIYSSFKLLTDPPNSKISNADKEQYLNNWPAGYGVSQIVDILKEDVKKGEKVTVGTEGTFGLLPYALQIYFYSESNIQITGYWPVRDIPMQILESAKDRKTYFVFNESQNLSDSPNNPRLRFVGKYQKGTSQSFMRLYEILP